MLRRVVEYRSDGVPSSADIDEAVRIAGTERVVVKLSWHFPYSGEHTALIYPEDTVEEAENKIPRTYGV